MSVQAADTSVRASIVVETPVERAFRVFTEEMSSWWNPDHHILQGELAEMVFEPRVGGHIYDRRVDGKRCGAYASPQIAHVVTAWPAAERCLCLAAAARPRGGSDRRRGRAVASAFGARSG
jgi:hypothetical protein